MRAIDIIRAAIPEADDGLAEHILWDRTPFPCGNVTARSLYKAASALKRAHTNGNQLCELCHRIAEPESDCCAVCRDAMDKIAREAV